MCTRHVLCCATIAAFIAFSSETTAQPSAVRIVVIAGEDAINVVQQKTAVAPVIEVRDRNDQPVAGAVVTFAVRSGRATLSGSRTLTVTTNATGRAVASGLMPTGAGAVKISAAAAFQGQSVAVTIAQTNVMTAAQAAAMSGAGASGAGAGGAGTAGSSAAGGAGGLSTATTLGIVGGAVAGGAVAVNSVLSGPAGTDYTGTFAGPLVATGPPPFCGYTVNMSGTLTIRIEEISASVARGSARFVVDSMIHYNATCRLADLPPGHETYEVDALTGAQDDLRFQFHNDYTFVAPDGSGNNIRGTVDWSFSGNFDGMQIVGVLTDHETDQSITGPPISSSGTVAFPVTLR